MNPMLLWHISIGHWGGPQAPGMHGMTVHQHIETLEWIREQGKAGS